MVTFASPLRAEFGNLPEVLDLFTQMHERVEAFGGELPAALAEWEVQDMHRKYPNTSQPDPHTAFTLVWPRSRRSSPHRPKPHITRAPSPRRGLPRMVRAHRGARPSSHRPILRPELFEKLSDRMRTLMVNKLKWR